MTDLVGSNHGRVLSDALGNHRVGADVAVVTDGDVANYLCSGTEDDSVTDGWVTLGLHVLARTQSHLMEHHHVVTDHCGLTDDHAIAVVDDETAANGGTRVNFDAGPELSPVADQSRQQEEVGLPEPISNPVGPDGVDARRGQ